MRYLFIFLLLNSGINCFGQGDTSWVSRYRKALVCIGTIQVTKDYKNVSNSKFNSVGSGLIMYVKDKKGEIIPCLITAKHVFESRRQNWFPSSLQLRFYGSDTLSFSKYLGIQLKLLDKGKKLWFELPDSTVDIACIPLIDQYISMNKSDPVSITPLPYNAIAQDEDIYDGAEVMVLGFPGIAPSDVLVKTILRRGVISWTNPTNPTSSKFLIDCNIFPGNSGGPVFTLPLGINRKGEIMNGGYIKFAGIVTLVYNEPQNAFDSLGNNVYDNYNRTIYYKQRGALASAEPASKVRELLAVIQNIILKEN